MDQYLLIPFLVGWTSIYQLFLCSPGGYGFDPSPCVYSYTSSTQLIGDFKAHQTKKIVHGNHSIIPTEMDMYTLWWFNGAMENRWKWPIEIDDIYIYDMSLFNRVFFPLILCCWGCFLGQISDVPNHPPDSWGPLDLAAVEPAQLGILLLRLILWGRCGRWLLDATQPDGGF